MISSANSFPGLISTLKTFQVIFTRRTLSIRVLRTSLLAGTKTLVIISYSICPTDRHMHNTSTFSTGIYNRSNCAGALRTHCCSVARGEASVSVGDSIRATNRGRNQGTGFAVVRQSRALAAIQLSHSGKLKVAGRVVSSTIDTADRSVRRIITSSSPGTGPLRKRCHHSTSSETLIFNCYSLVVTHRGICAGPA